MRKKLKMKGPGEWTSVNEDLPDGVQEVLVTVVWANGTRSVTESWYEDGGWAMGSAKGFKVTHWMPMPEPAQ